jgi:DNA-binding NtrC family response regulator
MCSHRRKILNVARDESLLKHRTTILEGAGYEVVPALSMLDVEKVCKDCAFDLVILGYALPNREKRRVMAAVRQFCGEMPILELYSHGSSPVGEQSDEQLPIADEQDPLLAKVSEMLTKKRKRRRAAL